jgi:alpha-mannosidase
VALLNNGRYGHSVFDGAIRVSLARAAKYPDPGADHGRQQVTLAVHPHGAGLAEVRDAAALLNAPLRVVSVPGVSAGADAATPVVQVSSSTGGVEVDAVKIADDGSGDLIVRLHEACGNRAAVDVQAHRRVAEAWRCNLLEEPDHGEEAGDGIVSLTLRPFQLVTLRLRLSDELDGRTFNVT